MLELTGARGQHGKTGAFRAVEDFEVASKPDYPLPLVSVVVVNYNYAAYLREAVESVVRQTYPFIECVVVDDCSTDDSPLVIDGLKRQYPQINIVTTGTNGGQSASTLAGIANSSGTYIIFLDADDYLYPTCVEAHIKAHLALRIPVGFTSVDMVQLYEGRVVTASAPCFSRFVASKEGQSADTARILATNPDLPSLMLGETPIEKLLHYVDPTKAGGWPWSPTSGNCFRRDALRFIINNPRLAGLRSCTDAYLLRGVACLTGSALIDLPLVGYRLHGKNDFVKSANLNRVKPYDVGYLKSRSNQATMMLIDHLISTVDDLAMQLEATLYFREAINALDDVHPPIHDSGQSYTTQQLILHRDRVRTAIGAEEYDVWLIHRCIPGVIKWIFLYFPPARRLFGSTIMPFIVKATRRRTAPA